MHRHVYYLGSCICMSGDLFGRSVFYASFHRASIDTGWKNYKKSTP